MADWQSEDGRVYVKMTDAEIAQLTYKQALEEWHWLNDRIHGKPSFNERMGVPPGPKPTLPPCLQSPPIGGSGRDEQSESPHA